LLGFLVLLERRVLDILWRERERERERERGYIPFVHVTLEAGTKVRR
jgi:hypothetical protein